MRGRPSVEDRILKGTDDAGCFRFPCDGAPDAGTVLSHARTFGALSR